MMNYQTKGLPMFEEPQPEPAPARKPNFYGIGKSILAQAIDLGPPMIDDEDTYRDGPGIHYAKLENSPRLQRLLALLKAAGKRGATTRDISLGAEIFAASTAVVELRKNGFTVRRIFEKTTERKANVHRYFLEGGPGCEVSD
jgi:hypothetical protein